MSLPFFYIKSYDGAQKLIELEEETSKHIVQVLRMNVGEQLNLTDGKGTILNCEITTANKRHCEVKVLTPIIHPVSVKKITIAISLLKNANRFEWFLEKATEIGVTEIIPIICERTEKEKFRYDRMQGICISAMLQSQQCWLPVLHQPIHFIKLVDQMSTSQKFIAHCEEGIKQPLYSYFSIDSSSCICIGPEGDFTEKEIQIALQNNFIPVSLGATRLRTETAGIVAAIILNQ